MSPLAYAALAALANVAGALVLTTRPKWSRRSLEFVLAFSAGFLIAVSLMELLPAAIRQTDLEDAGRNGLGGAVSMVLAGFMLVHLTQHALVQHFHFGEEEHAVEGSVGITALLGLMLHTFIDGVAIATSFAVEPRLGMLVFAAIVLHKLPEGLAIGSIFLAAGASKRAAIGAAAALGVATIVGAALSGSVPVLKYHGLALSAGVTLYVGASNLIPEFQGKKGWGHNAWFFAGVLTYVATTWF